MSFENEPSALSLLEAAAKVLRKREPSLTEAAAFAKIFSDSSFRDLAKLEREESAARLAGVPVASLEPRILGDLSDDEINALTVEIKNANPWMTDADLIRAIANSVEVRQGRAAYSEGVRQARREGQRVPQATDRLSSPAGDEYGAIAQKGLSDDDLLRLVDYERRLRPYLSAREIYSRVASSHAARRDRREFHAELEAAHDDETASLTARDDAMDALTAKAAELRRGDPSLTAEMAFSKAYSDPANRKLAARERRANRPEG